MEKRKFCDNELETVMPSFSFKGTLGNSVFRKKNKKSAEEVKKEPLPRQYMRGVVLKPLNRGWTTPLP